VRVIRFTTSDATTSARAPLSSSRRGVHNDLQIYAFGFEFFMGSQCLEAFSELRPRFAKDILPSHLWAIAAACDSGRSQVK
jgi:hypothetical protein